MVHDYYRLPCFPPNIARRYAEQQDDRLLYEQMSIMRAFVAIRQSLIRKPVVDIDDLQAEIKEIKAYIEEVFTDYNDINEDTRMQIELINQSLAELHTDKKITSKPRNKIGFITQE